MITHRLSASFQRGYFDKKANSEGFLLCGVDEVGRGCLAGPVVASAAIIKPGSKGCYLDDSKVMTVEQREKAYRWLMHNSWHGTAIVHNRAIDQSTIHQATLMAMKRAVMQLCARYNKIPAVVLVDAMPLKLPEINFEHPNCPTEAGATGTDTCTGNTSTIGTGMLDTGIALDHAHILENPWNKVIYFPFGESRSRSIAAASIIAKVTRDRLMATLEHTFPGYSLAQHKGYGTKAHQAEILMSGASVIHRQRFLSFLWEESKRADIPENMNIFETTMIEEHRL